MNDDISIPLSAPTVYEYAPSGLNRSRGPHRWDTVQPSDFGPTWDFELENHIDLWIITPVSEAALQWCYCHLPVDCPRWGARGHVIEADYVRPIIAHMRRDKLMSPEDYEQAEQENHALMLQGENRG